MCHPIDFTNCTSSCKTGGHKTYGECLRAKGLSTAAGDTTKSSPPTKPNDALTKKGASSALLRKTDGRCGDCGELGWHKRECPQVRTVHTVLPGCSRPGCGQEECATVHMTARGHDFEDPSEPELCGLEACDVGGFCQARSGCPHGEATPPPCANHRETQHRDRQPPWCNACGWRHAVAGAPAVKLSRPSLAEKVSAR